MKKRIYIIINYLVICAILAIFMYCAFFEKYINYKVAACIHSELLGGPCPLCGLLNGISAILHFNFTQAGSIQPNSVQVFLLLSIQLILRGLIIFLVKHNKYSLKVIFNSDIIISSLLFLWFTKHFLLQSIYIYYKMILTGNI